MNQTPNLKLLLVDDDETFCYVLKTALEKRNFSVTCAETIAQGIASAEKIKPQFAIVDLRIGHDSGLELIQKLSATSPDIRIEMLTGYSSVATAVESIKLGAVHYLTKPASTDEIINALYQEEGDPSVQINPQPLPVRRLEWEHLQKVLMQNNGNISAAARALNMHRRTLQRKLDKRPVRE